MTIQEIIVQIVDGNILFTRQHPPEYFESFKKEQKPYITLVTCSDSRVPLNVLMNDTSNIVFSIQNIGNQVLSTAGFVDYGIYHKGQGTIVIVNLNNHKDVSFIHNMSEFNELTTEQKEIHIGRLPE